MDDWRELPSSRFFLWAERLPAYDGAVRAALARELSPAAATPLPTSEPPVAAVEVPPATLAAMSDHPGFPGIEYTGG